ncbi:hypothetical protein RRF57_004670 [Xylaria bambusicola]|uniref:Uncharacterized protein n=1 Tax=Xylaria bambusicola TaxID=326684 RepID=A0AAN7YX73_9PEZI
MTVLVAPKTSNQDQFIVVSSVYAWHSPILAAWELTDLSLFPSEVSSRKSSIAEYGWVASSTSAVTSVPLASISGTSTLAPQDSNSDSISLNHGVIAGIVVAAIAFVGFALASIYAYRRLRRHQRQNRPGGMGTVLPVNRGTWLENAWRAEMSSPATSSQLPTHEARNQGSEKQTPIELDSGSAISPVQSQGCGSIVSSTSHRVALFSPALVEKSVESKDHGEGTVAEDKEPYQRH